MGANSSTAMSSNISKISQNTNVSSQQSCNNSQVIQIGRETVQVGNINCDKLLVGNVTAISNVTCNQYQEVAVLSKVTADQLAQSLAKTGIGAFDSALAYSSNYIDVQNNLNVIMSSSCINSQDVNIEERILTAGNISGSDCQLFNDGISQNASCIQTIKADITNSTDVKQTADSKAIAGLDIGDLIMLIIAICVLVVLVMIASIVMKSLLKPSIPKFGGSGGGGSRSGGGRSGNRGGNDGSGSENGGGETLSYLVQMKKSLQAQLKARTEAIARRVK